MKHLKQFMKPEQKQPEMFKHFNFPFGNEIDE